MILNSDIMLHHPLWERVDNELCNKDGIGLFNRLIDVYILACAIGIKEDKVIDEIEEPLASPKSIGRNTYMSMTNTDLKETLDFMLQNALINSNTIKFNEEERIKLAFDPDYTVSKFSAAAFLTGFANYGIKCIMEQVDSNSPIVVIDGLYQYFNSLAESKYEEILRTITLEELSKM